MKLLLFQAGLKVFPLDNIVDTWTSLVESIFITGWSNQSENSTDDPVVFWFNGGPGCSSLDGYLYELGPFHVVEPYTTTGQNTLYYNPSTWAKVANVVFLEAPACVGLSYADATSGCTNSDTQQAKDNFEALQVFFKGYPEFAYRDLYLTGESYAGMYVPTLALQILAYNNATTNAKIPLRGIAVGNGVIGQKTGEPSEQLQVDFLHGHGLFADNIYNAIVKDCGDFSSISPACDTQLALMSSQVGYVNIYDIYTDCVNSGSDLLDGHRPKVGKRPPNALERRMQELGLGGPVECLDGGAAQAWLDQTNVRTALHAKSVADIGPWELCTNKLKYTENWGSLLPYYKYDIIPFIRVLIYNGDVDACVPYNGNEWWTSTLGISQTTAWTEWLVNTQVAGYLTKYQDNFSFITVKGAGHMVPEYKPVQALEMFSRWLNNTCC